MITRSYELQRLDIADLAIEEWPRLNRLPLCEEYTRRLAVHELGDQVKDYDDMNALKHSYDASQIIMRGTAFPTGTVYQPGMAF